MVATKDKEKKKKTRKERGEEIKVKKKVIKEATCWLQSTRKR